MGNFFPITQSFLRQSWIRMAEKIGFVQWSRLLFRRWGCGTTQGRAGSMPL